MSPAVGFALLSLVFAGIIDVLYRGYSRVPRSRGLFLLGMGLVWAVLQLVAVEVRAEHLAGDAATLGFGVAAGIMLTLSNLLLIESFTHLDVSLGSTIYRLNTVGVVVLSVVFLGEPLGALKLLGIACGIGAAVALYERSGGGPTGRVLALFFAIAVAASLMRASFNVTSKAGLSAGGSATTMMLIAAICWVLGGGVYAVLRERALLGVNRTVVLYAGISGLVVFMVANSLILALSYGEASVVAPIANLSFVVALAISVAIGMEAMTWRKALAVALAACSIVILSRV
ncbi:MAG: EamA/RhaT family transporter [Gammaproteobacteria bacterium]|nr:EamA/RhaT family transporter [Gammaproteobacteria bacterium]